MTHIMKHIPCLLVLLLRSSFDHYLLVRRQHRFLYNTMYSYIHTHYVRSSMSTASCVATILLIGKTTTHASQWTALSASIYRSMSDNKLTVFGRVEPLKARSKRINCSLSWILLILWYPAHNLLPSLTHVHFTHYLSIGGTNHYPRYQYSCFVVININERSFRFLLLLEERQRKHQQLYESLRVIITSPKTLVQRDQVAEAIAVLQRKQRFGVHMLPLICDVNIRCCTGTAHARQTRKDWTK
jgi:hypothetical protein